MIEYIYYIGFGAAILAAIIWRRAIKDWYNKFDFGNLIENLQPIGCIVISLFCCFSCWREEKEDEVELSPEELAEYNRGWGESEKARKEREKAYDDSVQDIKGFILSNLTNHNARILFEPSERTPTRYGEDEGLEYRRWSDSLLNTQIEIEQNPRIIFLAKVNRAYKSNGDFFITGFIIGKSWKRPPHFRFNLKLDKESAKKIDNIPFHVLSAEITTTSYAGQVEEVEIKGYRDPRNDFLYRDYITLKGRLMEHKESLSEHNFDRKKLIEDAFNSIEEDRSKKENVPSSDSNSSQKLDKPQKAKGD